MVLGHLGAVERLEGALVAGATGHFRDITLGTQAIGREGSGQRRHVVVVEIACHPDAIPGGCPGWRRDLPRLKRLGVVAIGAIDAERLRHVHHQAVGELGLLGRVAVCRSAGHGQCFIPVDPDRLGVLQIMAERIVGQRGIAHAGSRLVLAFQITQQGAGRALVGWRKPDLVGHRIATVTGVAGHTGRAHMRLPVGIDVLRHLQHPPGDDLGVLRVVGEIRAVVAVGATFLGGDPLRDRHHVACKLTDAQLTKHLDVLVNVLGLRTVGARRRRRLGRCVERRLGDEQPLVVKLLHASAAIACLDGFDWRSLATCQHNDRCKRQYERSEAKCSDHYLAPIVLISTRRAEASSPARFASV